jgi:hypothetical protein
MWMVKKKKKRKVGDSRAEGERAIYLYLRLAGVMEGLCYNWYWYCWGIRRESVNITWQVTRQTGSSRKMKAALSVKERDRDDAG